MSRTADRSLWIGTVIEVRFPNLTRHIAFVDADD